MDYIIEVFVGLLLAVAGLGLLARTLQVPYPVLLVIGGSILGLIPRLPRVQLKPDVVFSFLPAAAPVARNLVHIVAGFSRQPPGGMSSSSPGRGMRASFHSRPSWRFR